MRSLALNLPGVVWIWRGVVSEHWVPPVSARLPLDRPHSLATRDEVRFRRKLGIAQQGSVTLGALGILGSFTSYSALL